MHIETIHTITGEVMQAFERLMPQLNPQHTPPTHEALQAVVESEASTLLFARSDAGELIGMLTLVVFRTPAGVHSLIEDVVVDERARGQGVGEALTRAGIQLARDQGAHAVDLTSRPAREAANRLYQRMGFQRRETNLYRLPLD